MAAYSLQINGKPRVQNLFMSSVFLHDRPSLCHMPLKVTMSQEQQATYCQAIRADIEAHLKQAIPLKPPLSVFEPMHHLTFSVPPDSAPALCVAACELVGGRRSQALTAAATLHLLHAATFTHENLPLTDRPKPKHRPNNLKPKPAAHHAFGPNIELLIPDAMVPFGLQLLAMSDDPAQNASDRVLRVILEITRVGGSQGIVDALYQEMLVNQSDGGGDDKESRDVEWIDDTCWKKEGALHACAAACGAILGGANEEEIEKLRKYGLYVGMIQGYSNRVESKGKELERVVELRNLAIKELEHFKLKGRNVEAISSFVIGL